MPKPRNIKGKPSNPKSAPRANSTQPRSEASTIASPDTQQAILNVFARAFADLLNPNTLSDNLYPLLQQVKHHLYERDFSAAFGTAEYLDAYTVRWSPSRALGYFDVFQRMLKHLPTEDTNDPNNRNLNVVVLGAGGGAEVVALAALQQDFQLKRALKYLDDSGSDNVESSPQINVTAFDAVEWSHVIRQLVTTAVSTPLPKAGVVRLADPSTFHVDFHVLDVLSSSAPNHQSLLSSLEAANIVSLMFILNELYASSISKAQLLLLRLTQRLKANALLLIVDSPGSYSTVHVGANASDGTTRNASHTKKRRYPMAWLADHALLQTASESVDSAVNQNPGNESPAWEKLLLEESSWFRIPRDGLKYPIDLENMRYQLHLYRKR